MTRSGSRDRRALVAAWVATAVVVSGLLAGCTDDSDGDDVDHPEGSRALVLNQPTAIGDFRVVASNVTADDAGIDVVGDGPAQGDRVALGDEATIGGFTFTLVDIVLDDDADAAPGGSATTVWILPSQ